MSKISEMSRYVFELAMLTERVLEAVGLASNMATPVTAADAIMLIRSLHGALTEATTGKVTPLEAHSSLDRLLGEVAAHDAAADAALLAKFPSK